MLSRDWSWLLLGLLWLLVACQSISQEETPTPSPTAAQITEPTLTRSSTVTPPPARAPTFTPAPTITPEVPTPVSAGWQPKGNVRLGLRMAAPDSWYDMTASLRILEYGAHFGPRFLALADSDNTAGKLLAGAPIESGAYVFGYVTEPLSPGTDPGRALSDMLAAAGLQDTSLEAPVDISLDGVQGAYVDSTGDPLNTFSPVVEARRHRLYLLLQPGTRTPIVFLMGATADDWDDYEDTFESMVETISLNEVGLNVNEHLFSGDIVEGSLEKDAVDLWTFNGVGSRYATITLTPDESSNDLTLTLIDPSGDVMVSMDNGFAGDLELLTDILLPEVGTYIIEASEFFNEAGGYKLSFLLSDEPQFSGGGRLDFGAEIESELSEKSEHKWVFDGTAGQEITIILTALSPNLDVILELRGPDGRDLAALDEGFAGDAEVLTGVELPITGEHVITVRGFAGQAGAYSLSLDEGGESTANFYDAGDLVHGDSKREFLREDEVHAWFIDGQAGDGISIEVTPLESNMDMDIWLLDPDLNEAALKDEFLSGEAEMIEYELPSDGSYVLLVREFFGEPGEYEIALNVTGDQFIEIAGALEYGQTITGELALSSQMGWTFSGLAADVVNVTLVPTSPDRDLVLVLMDPAGNAALTVDANLSGLPEQLIDYVLTADGEWTIVVREFFSESSSFELSLAKRE